MRSTASIPWLLRHELLITWRTWFQRKGRKKRRIAVPPPVVAFVILLIATAAVGVPAAIALRGNEIIVTPLIAVMVDAGLLLIFTLMLSQTLVAAVDAFYERGDLDLLLSSPVPPRRILFVRALAMATNPALLFWAIATPFVVPMAILGHPELLSVYVVVGGLALASTAVGLAVAIALFSSIGPRRTRTVAQVLAAIVGAAFVIAAQVPNFLARNDDAAFGANWLISIANSDGFPRVVTLPAEAFLGSAVPLIVIVLISFAVFALVANWVGRRFARDAAAASGADTIRTRKGRTDARFGASMLRATIGKEFKLLLRDPGLVSQVLLRVFYVIPLAVVILTDKGDINSVVPSIAAGAAALLAGQLAGSIAWLTLSAEDSPELLASAPIPIRAFWRAKLAVSFLIPAALLVLPLIALTILNPVAGLVGIVAAAASAWSAAMINLWLQKPTKRSEFRRSWSSTLGANLLELSTSACIAAAAGMAVAGLVSAWIPAALALGIVVLARRSEAAVLERMTGAA